MLQFIFLTEFLRIEVPRQGSYLQPDIPMRTVPVDLARSGLPSVRRVGFIFGVADFFEIAIDAARFVGPGRCGGHAISIDGRRDPSVLGNDFHRIELDFFRIFVGGEVEALR